MYGERRRYNEERNEGYDRNSNERGGKVNEERN